MNHSNRFQSLSNAGEGSDGKRGDGGGGVRTGG